MSAGERSFKVVLLGEGRVGKTSTVLRFVNNQFNDRQESTIQASYLKKTLVLDDKRVTLNVWDTAGQERFHALGPIYYRDADGALLVYDITDADTFEKVKSWVKELRKVVGPDIVICIAGNKCDLERQRQVSVEEANTYAQSVGATHFQTSAKVNRGIDQAFADLSKRMLTAKPEETGKKKRNYLQDDDVPAASSSASSNRRNVLRVVQDDEAPPPKKDGCC